MNAPSPRPATEESLPRVRATLSYVKAERGPVHTRVYPPTSGIATQRPEAVRHDVWVRDARGVLASLDLDDQGFECHTATSRFSDFFDDSAVRAHYYPEVRDILMSLTGARDVVVFDHNVRSAARAARGQMGVREPVDQVHNDYTLLSGPKRKLEILQAVGKEALADHRVAFVNLWRPLVGPIQDNPLAVCDAQSVSADDLIDTEIHHFGENDLETPRHRGQIYSVRHNPAHRWYYVSDMQPREFLLLKNYDSRDDGVARFMPHTGFNHPDCPVQHTPRESIEARTLVIFDEPA
ncbi:MAG: methyltransferase [Betaproteobacteria bacterium]|nr:methyltransferase [Betaproteobacteria bacterium]